MIDVERGFGNVFHAYNLCHLREPPASGASMMDIPPELINRFRSGQGTFFLSAGCSIPSGIPSAQSLAQQVALAEYERSGSRDDFATFKQVTFGVEDPPLDVVAEYFHGRDGDLTAFLSAIRFDDWIVPDNRAHRGVVRLALEGLVRRVITTNWDELIEAAGRQSGCRMVRVRKQEELGEPEDVELKLLKIHGCASDPSSIIAATSQIEGADKSSLWAQPQVGAMFHDTSVVFIGYSGSSEKISHTMAQVAEWSPDDLRHYAVDVANWDVFRTNAAEFVAAASLTEDQFYMCGAEEFVSTLVGEILRAEVIHLVHTAGAQESEDILALTDGLVAEFVADDEFIESLASADGSEAFMRGLLRKIDRLPPLKPNARIVARVAAWTSLLRERGWNPMYGLPVLRRNRDRIYLAAGTPGMAAKTLAQHVLSTLSDEHVRSVIVGDDPDATVTCVLLLAQGDVGSALLDDVVTGGSTHELTQSGPARMRFITEPDLLREVA